MIGLVQRVSKASVTVNDQVIGEIGRGILVLLGIEKSDTQLHVDKLCDKIINYRLFSDPQGKMNLNVQQVAGEILLVSQFTLVADTTKGNRPGFSRGAPPALGESLYEAFKQGLAQRKVPFACGQFGADMQVALINDGPVTFTLRV